MKINYLVDLQKCMSLYKPIKIRSTKCLQKKLLLTFHKMRVTY